MRSRQLVSLIFLVSTVAFAAAPRVVASPADREALKKTMESVIEKSTLKNARVSVQVRSLEDGTVVFSKDPDELLNPASNVKLYTAAAALARLGVEYRFETEFLVDPEFKDGKAKTLWVRGRGDPSISTERLYGIVSELMHAGLKEVQDIVVDDSWFDSERLPPGFDQEYGDRAYLAPTGALSLNSNTVGVYLRPAENPGGKEFGMPRLISTFDESLDGPLAAMPAKIVCEVAAFQKRRHHDDDVCVVAVEVLPGVIPDIASKATPLTGSVPSGA